MEYGIDQIATPTPPIAEIPDTCPDLASGEVVYVLTNVSLPELIKIGRTDRSAEERAQELSSATGVPTPFKVFRTFAVNNSLLAETRIHARLESYRLVSNREFFRIDADWACAVIQEMFPQNSVKVSTFEGIEGDGVLQLQATNLRHKHSYIWPGLLAAELSISYTDAISLFRVLNENGTIGENGNWTFFYQ